MDLNRLETALAEAAHLITGVGSHPAEAAAARDLAIRARKLSRALARPQALGVFGPSQAGKSFLIGALLAHELGTLTVRGRSEDLDFLKEVNPAKGVESTGVVTRFTSHKPALSHGQFYCRLLSLDAVLEALATGFLVECTAPAITADRIDSILRDARSSAGTQAAPRYREAWETAFHGLGKRYQERHPYLSALRAHTELTSGAFAGAVTTVEGWKLVYSLLWGGAGTYIDLDALFTELFAALETVGHAQDVEIGSEHLRASSRDPSVIDASCLNALGQRATPISVYAQEISRTAELAPGALSALIAEIVLPLSKVAGSLLEKADVLDFPGGRALKGINGFGATELKSGRIDNAIEVYKRGKLTFLFEQFAVEREVTALLLCSPGPTKPEAIQLQSQVESWLRIRHGSDVPQTTEEIDEPSLYLALTKFDMSLGALRSDNAKERWESRVQEACVDFWARSHRSWLLNWGQAGRAFDNLYWIRNPYADQMQSLRPGTPDFEEVKRGYQAAKAVARHIREADAKWAAVEGDDPELGLPRSGVPLLARALGKKLAVNMKARELSREGDTIRREFAVILRALTPSRDAEEANNRKRDNAAALLLELEQSMATRASGAVFARFAAAVALPHAEVTAEVRTLWESIAPLSIKASEKVKRLLVAMLKHWQTRALARVRDAGPALPVAAVDIFLRELCTSKLLLPKLGNALFPLVNRQIVDTDLLASIFELTLADNALDLFHERPRQTPSGAITLSYAERNPGKASANGAAAAAASDSAAGGIDWTDVSFEEGAAPAPTQVVFAGSPRFAHFKHALADFYVASGTAAASLVATDPSVKTLAAMLRELEPRA